MDKGKFKKGLVATAAGVLIVGGIALTGASAASTATVYNRLYCDIDTGLCYQVNGAHNSSIKNQCFWQHGGTAGYPNYYDVDDCAGPANAGWGTPIWQWAP